MTSPPRSLVRAMSRWDLAALAVNFIIGSGIFVLPSSAAALTGAWSPLAFLLCAGITYLVVLCFAEVGSRFEDSGGPYLYARVVFGRFSGFEIGWTMWLARASAFAANCLVLISYLSFFVPQVSTGAGRAGILIAVTGALVFVNLRGVANSARLTGLFAAVKIGALLLFAVSGMAFVDWSRLSPTHDTPQHASWGAAILLLIYAFTGFESVPVTAAEAKNPKRDLPIALMWALGACATIYVAVQVVAIGTVEHLALSERPLADAARNFMGPAAGGLMSALVCISVIGNLSASIFMSPRLTYALAERGDLPEVFAKLHAVHRTPTFSILFFGIVATILAVTGTFVWLATISVLARIMSYLVTAVALPVLRQRWPGPAFKIPGGIVVSAATTLVCLWLLAQAPLADIRNFAIAAAAGAVLYFTRR